MALDRACSSANNNPEELVVPEDLAVGVDMAPVAAGAAGVAGFVGTAAPVMPGERVTAVAAAAEGVSEDAGILVVAEVLAPVFTTPGARGLLTAEVERMVVVVPPDAGAVAVGPPAEGLGASIPEPEAATILRSRASSL